MSDQFSIIGERNTEDILDMMDADYLHANSSTLCKRKGNAATAIGVVFGHAGKLSRVFNGPTPGWECLNIKGGCGCTCAEVKLICKMLKIATIHKIIVATSYSPCGRCCQLLITSNIVEAVVYKWMAPHHENAIKLLEGARIPVYSYDQIAAKLLLDRKAGRSPDS